MSSILSSRGSSRSTTSPESSQQFEPDTNATMAFQNEILQPNNIHLAQQRMSDEAWSDLAFSLGLPAKEAQRASLMTQKLAQRMKKRKTLSPSQTAEYLTQLLESIVTSCPLLGQRGKTSFHHDAVPTSEALRNTTRRLPLPKPATSIGYEKSLFSSTHDELQEGIICGPSAEPCDLSRISQPVPGHFWPFFVVEVSEQSMLAARQASAISAATCNHALKLLASAATDDHKDWQSHPFTFDQAFAKSFSLSVCGKVACLSVHSIEKDLVHFSRPVMEYRLDDANEVALMAHRIYGISVWARHNRLGEIVATLDQLDKRVHGSVPRKQFGHDTDGTNAAHSKGCKPTSRRPDRVKVALRAGLPFWLRA